MPDRSRHPLRSHADVLLAVSAGGALGSVARWGVAEALPHRPDQLPWSTAVVNLTGAFLIGALMVLVLDVWPPTRLVRPFVGVGVLGGYTTFSTYALDTHDLLAAGRPVLAGGYVVGTLLGGLLAVWLGIVVARAVVAAARRRQDGGGTRGRTTDLEGTEHE